MKWLVPGGPREVANHTHPPEPSRTSQGTTKALAQQTVEPRCQKARGKARVAHP